MHVADDAPVAANDAVTLSSATAASGNVLTNDTKSMDAPTLVSAVTFNGVTTTIAPNASVDITGAYGVLHIASDGGYTYTEQGGLNGTDNFTYTAKDFDGDASQAATLAITVTNGTGGGGNDHPIVTSNPDINIDETNNREKSGVVIVNFGHDSPGTIIPNGTFSADGSLKNGTLTSNGAVVTISQVGNFIIGSANGHDVFHLAPVLTNSNGFFDFTLMGPLDHADGTNPNDVINLHFGVTATDSNGDTTTGVINVHVADDAPIAVDDLVTSTNDAVISGNVLSNDTVGFDATNTPLMAIQNTTVNANGSASVHGVLGTLVIDSHGSYTYTPDANASGTDTFNYMIADADGDHSQIACLTITVTSGVVNDHPVITSTPVDINIDETDKHEGTSVVSVNFGHDSPGTIVPNLSFSADGSLKNGTLTSNGAAITISQAGNYIIGSANGHDIFHFAPVLTNSSGLFDFNLLGPLDHADGTNPNDVINLHFGVTATDSNGDTATTTVTVHVADDAPVANADTNSTAANTAVSGNVFSNDNFGFDGQGGLALVQSIHFLPGNIPLPVTIGGGGTIHGLLGSLAIDAAGNYTYTPDAGSSGTDNFTYVISDADGDRASANLSITIAPQVIVVPPTVSVALTTNNGNEAHVYEDGNVFVPIHAHVSGGDSSATLTINVSGISYWDWTYSGSGGLVDQENGVLSVTLAPGITDWDGGFTVAPPHDADFDINNIVVTATVHDNGATATDTHNFPIINDAVADQPFLNAQDGQAYDPWSISTAHDAPLNIQAGVTDTDGSEAITKITFDLNSPLEYAMNPYNVATVSLEQVGFSLNKGVDNGGVWEIDVQNNDVAGALSGVAIHQPPFPAFNDGIIDHTYVGVVGADITVRAYSQEVNLSGGEFDYTNNTAVTSVNYHFSFEMTPLVLDLNGDGVNLVNKSAGVMFDMDNNGTLDHTSWVAPQDGLLAIDLNHDGVINNQSELFGNTSTTNSGFATLANYDVNGDGVINAKDADFSKLLVWQDVNQDGISQVGELHSLESLGIASINLNAADVNSLQGDSIISQQSVFTYADGHQGQIVDALFNVDDPNTQHVLNGTDYNDTLIGSSGSDVFYGGAGENIIYGNGGNDTFLFKSAHDGVDTIKDFHVGDVIDISGLIGHDPVQQSINDFVFKTESNGNTTISVDVTGHGDAAHAMNIAALQGVTGVNLDDIIHHAQQQAVAA